MNSSQQYQKLSVMERFCKGKRKGSIVMGLKQVIRHNCSLFFVTKSYSRRLKRNNHPICLHEGYRVVDCSEEDFRASVDRNEFVNVVGIR